MTKLRSHSSQTRRNSNPELHRLNMNQPRLVEGINFKNGERDGWEFERRKMHDRLMQMRYSSIVQALFNRRVLPIHFEKMTVQNVLSVNVNDPLMEDIINQVLIQLPETMHTYFTGVGHMLYVMEMKPILHKGKIIQHRAPRVIPYGSYSYVVQKRITDLQEQRLVRFDDARTTLKPRLVSSSLCTGCRADSPFFETECGALFPDYLQYLIQMKVYNDTIIARANYKPWAQNQAESQTMKPLELETHYWGVPGINRGPKRSPFNVREGDKVIVLPHDTLMCGFQPIPPLDLNSKDIEDRFNTRAAKLLKLASWETHDYSTAQYKNESQILQENQQQQSITSKIRHDLMSGMSAILHDMFQTYDIRFAVRVRPGVSYDLAKDMLMEGFVGEETMKRVLEDLHGLDKDDILRKEDEPHRKRLRQNYREGTKSEKSKRPVSKPKSQSKRKQK